MIIEPLHSDLIDYLRTRGLIKKFVKQSAFFALNPFHPSLNVEVLEPRHLRILSFRIDRKYRAIFIFTSRGTVEIVDINNHYH